MAPDRGQAPLFPAANRESEESDASTVYSEAGETQSSELIDASRSQNPVDKRYSNRHENGRSFTFRGVIAGLFVGVLICFSNMYFGLQTGWVSIMSMPASLIGFAIFKVFANFLNYPFSPVENVLVQTVAAAVGTMPLAAGFVGVIPALEYLLKPGEGAPIELGVWKLMFWALGIALFGVVFAVPLRKDVIIRERLRFPSGTATALMIAVLHGGKNENKALLPGLQRLGSDSVDSHGNLPQVLQVPEQDLGNEEDSRADWKDEMRLLIVSFAISGVYTLLTYFIPALRSLPIFGLNVANNWLWSLNPSPAYVGQGIIMGPATTIHMLLGAVLGWGILSPLAKSKGWAPGPIRSWETGSKGWIVWISLAIMLADAVVSLGWLAGRPISRYAKQYGGELAARARQPRWKDVFRFQRSSHGRYTALRLSEETPEAIAQDIANINEHPNIMRRTASSTSRMRLTRTLSSHHTTKVEPDAPPEELVQTRTVIVGLVLSLGLTIITVQVVFKSIVPLGLIFLALPMALILSIVGVRALGETDLNPVSGISKVTQLVFAGFTAAASGHGVLINLVAGALSEAGAQQAGDLMQDLKAGHLLGASPKAQFYGQMIGTVFGAFLSPAIYKLYTHVYVVPGDLFQVPTAFVWVFTARLVLGKGLPEMAGTWAGAAAAIWVAFTVLRIVGKSRASTWTSYIPGGIAVAVGMYNVPSFTLARTIGGLLNWYWLSHKKAEETPLIVLASGLILGEGVLSIVNLILASLKIPHL